ncbi:hypothetical protein [Nitrosopumilus sp.]|uniref:hypothetical protein n=1 Tax=Nitrosopumilus sp. TaxID=2024843 RepID=UPI00247D7E36|nr:hypothetical protein [Nitrosopumilus sp.]MCV0431840.1 hypothetical protein [Nitrosopumilus sp.]
MKTGILFLVLITFGVFQFHESFAEDYFSVPSCYVGVFVTDHVQCSTRDSPPCPEPSFEKNGFCVVKKLDICQTGYVLRDGLCLERNEYFRVDDPTFARQSLQTGESLGNSGNLFGWFGLLLSSFIVFAYVIMKIKKRKKENEN